MSGDTEPLRVIVHGQVSDLGRRLLDEGLTPPDFAVNYVSPRDRDRAGVLERCEALIVDHTTSRRVAGPSIGEHLASTLGLGPVFEWSWKILQWPLAFFLVSSAVGLVYYYAPDAEQEWVEVSSHPSYFSNDSQVLPEPPDSDN